VALANSAQNYAYLLALCVNKTVLVSDVTRQDDKPQPLIYDFFVEKGH